MKLVGFNFSKISIDKADSRPKETKISTNIDVSEIKALKPDLFKTKEEIISVKFTYVIGYEPDYAKIDLAGTAIFTVDSKAAKEITKKWKKKNMPEEFKVFLFNIILMKSNVKALQLEEEMNLPYHMPLPSFKPQKEEKEK